MSNECKIMMNCDRIITNYSEKVLDYEPLENIEHTRHSIQNDFNSLLKYQLLLLA